MIAILLGTYNGKRYLREQLDSLYKQTEQDFHIYIRDDNSTDETPDIINEYAANHPNITIIENHQGNIGVKRNFELLLAYAQADYYMFCDQDDVWLPNKIEVTLAKFRQLESEHGNIPLLVHTDLEVVDSSLKTINSSFWQYVGIAPQLSDNNRYYLGVANSVTGCTMMINEKAKQAALPFSGQALMHDAWIAICTIAKGKIGYIPTSTIKYRQHDNNVCGAVEANSSGENKLSAFKKIYEYNKKQYLNAHPVVFKNILQYMYYKMKYMHAIRRNK